jgi:hypothetical protein
MNIKVKNKKISYSEKLNDNLYTIEASYIKPATRNEDAKKIQLNIQFNFYMRESNLHYETEQAFDAGLTIYLNGKYISARSSIGRGLTPRVAGWVSDIEYNSSYNPTLTAADAGVIGELIQAITSVSTILDFDELRTNITARDIVYNLKQNIEDENKARETIAKLKEEYETMLVKYNLTASEASALVLLVDEGAQASTMLNNVTKLMA